MISNTLLYVLYTNIFFIISLLSVCQNFLASCRILQLYFWPIVFQGIMLKMSVLKYKTNNMHQVVFFLPLLFELIYIYMIRRIYVLCTTWIRSTNITAMESFLTGIVTKMVVKVHFITGCAQLNHFTNFN